MSSAGPGHYAERLPPLVTAAVATVIHAVLYGFANRVHLMEPIRLPLLLVDTATPFIPATVWIYLSDYALCFLGLSLQKDPGERRRFVDVFIVAVVLSAVAHWALPVEYPRMAYPVRAEGLSALALTLLREFDAPTSCMPSLHVTTALLSAIWAGKAVPSLRPVFLLWAAAIAASTLTLKQHYVLDVVAGGALALALAIALERRVHSQRANPFAEARDDAPFHPVVVESLPGSRHSERRRSS